MSQTAIQEVRPWEQPFWRPARGKEGILSYLDTRTGCHRSDSISAARPEDSELNSPFHGSGWSRHDGLLPSDAGAPHSQAEQSHRAPAGFLSHVQRLRGSGKLGRLPPAPSLTYRYAG